MSFRLAAYAVCIVQDRLLIVQHRATGHWTLPGGGVEHGEDPFEAVTRELKEETGCDGLVLRLLGIDSRVIPAAERLHGGPELHNVGVFYLVDIRAGEPRPDPTSEVSEAAWAPLASVPALRRSSLVDVGLDLAVTLPPTGHVAGVEIGDLVEH